MPAIIRHQLDHGVERISLNSGRGNPLTPELIADLNAVLDELNMSPPRALVLDADGARIFSAGFALPVIWNWNRERLWDFFSGFVDIVHKLLALPCPSVAAIEGHAIAGGFILSLATDFRVVGAGKLKLGLSEVDLGAAVPPDTQRLLAARTSEAQALWLSTTGELMTPEEALRCNYARILSESPLDDAIALATKLAQKPGCGASVNRQLFNHTISEEMKRAAERTGTFLDTWFSAEGQTHIAAMAARLSKK